MNDSISPPDGSLDGSTKPSPTAGETNSSNASPLFLGMVGLALMLVGWYASQWTPPRVPSQLDELRRMADDELRTRLERIEPAYRPLQWPGRFGLFLGVGLFVLAGVRMYRNDAVVTSDEKQKD
ncbi:MAG: hypothetical protein SNJ75_12575 [Gemmataceae bacterium]